MPILFLDCPDDMIGLWQRVSRSDDPTIRVNTANGQPHDVPALLGGYDICLNDHTYLNADLLRRCPALRHIVFLGTGASSFIDLAAATSSQHQSSHHKRLRRYQCRRTHHRYCHVGRAQRGAHGS